MKIIHNKLLIGISLGGLNVTDINNNKFNEEISTSYSLAVVEEKYTIQIRTAKSKNNVEAFCKKIWQNYSINSIRRKLQLKGLSSLPYNFLIN